MGLVKNLALGSERDRRAVKRAEAFMREVYLSTLSTEAQTNEFMLRSSGRKWSSCQRCPLAKARTRLVHGDGSTTPELVIVGEAPGVNEDATGLTFQGPAGSVLRRILASRKVAIAEERFFITNTVGCVSLDGSGQPRKPDQEAREACRPRLEEVLSILRPRVILLLGATAGHWFGTREVGTSRGLVPRSRWPQVAGDGFSRLRAVIQTYHPSAVLRAEGRVQKRRLFYALVSELVLARRAIDQVRREEEASGVRSVREAQQ